MSLLINIKQRIKVIETIRKTTHAMRLISMSNNARLRSKKKLLEIYQQEIARLSALAKHLYPNTTLITTSSQILFIYIGAQKGLCGTFNSQLVRFIEEYFSSHPLTESIHSAVGKQLIERLATLKNISLTQTFPLFNQQNFTTLAHSLTQEILTLRYKKVVVISNHPQTFFIQLPQVTVIFPLPDTSNVPLKQEYEKMHKDVSYEWEGNPEEIINHITFLHLQTTLEMLLFQSLLAEQAARFISMDAATHNAENILNTMKLDYNKLRQATITRELTDLTSSII